jgi:cellulose synthase/poly-beta-1,6-N-acetylglucosamine synthase-like glycosyltransferase
MEQSMSALEISYWLAAGLVIYAYLGYPLGIALLARLVGKPVRYGGGFTGSVSIVLAAHNEERVIERRLRELSGLLAASGRPGEIIVVSDGSTDGTARLAKKFTAGPVRVLELKENAGKGEALTRGCAIARHDVVVFADARQSWDVDALEMLLRNFADPAVGAVSGELCVESGPGIMAGFGLYWRYEKWLRHLEGLVHSVVGVSGAICAVRRDIFYPIPAGTILDDVYWPLRVTMQGKRVIHEREAVAFDRLPQRPRDEFRRKVRTLSGNFQLVWRLPAALVPWRNPVWFQFVSHKLLRLLVPWALLAVLGLNFCLEGPLYLALLVAQLALYGFGLGSLCTLGGRPTRLGSAAGSFLLLNTAAWLAFWVWVCGKANRSWRKVTYGEAEPWPLPSPAVETQRAPLISDQGGLGCPVLKSSPSESGAGAS